MPSGIPGLPAGRREGLCELGVDGKLWHHLAAKREEILHSDTFWPFQLTFAT
jgi:hypothetical protein